MTSLEELLAAAVYPATLAAAFGLGVIAAFVASLFIAFRQTQLVDAERRWREEEREREEERQWEQEREKREGERRNQEVVKSIENACESYHN